MNMTFISSHEVKKKVCFSRGFATYEINIFLLISFDEINVIFTPKIWIFRHSWNTMYIFFPTAFDEIKAIFTPKIWISYVKEPRTFYCIYSNYIYIYIFQAAWFEAGLNPRLGNHYSNKASYS